MTMVLEDVSKNAMANALRARIDSGVSAGNIKFRTGTPPASADASEAAGVIVATFNFPSKPSFNAAQTSPNPAGTIGLIATGTPFDIGNNGPPTYFRIYTSTGSVVLQGIVGVDIGVTGASWQAGGTASISSLLINTSAIPPATSVDSGPITVSIVMGGTATIASPSGAAAFGAPLLNDVTVWQMGPIQVGSAHYAFAPINGTHGRQFLGAFKSTDNLATWSELNAANRPNSNQETTHTYDDGLVAGMAIQDPANSLEILMCVIAGKNDTTRTTCNYFTRFNTSSETWANSGTMVVLGVTSDIKLETTRVALSGESCAITANATGNIACFFHGDRFAGPGMQRAVCAYFNTSTFAWTSIVGTAGTVGSGATYCFALANNVAGNWFQLCEHDVFAGAYTDVTSYRYNYTATNRVADPANNQTTGALGHDSTLKGTIRGSTTHFAGSTLDLPGGAGVQLPALFTPGTAPQENLMAGSDNFVQITTIANANYRLSSVVACYDPVGDDYYVFFRKTSSTELRYGKWDGAAWTYESMGNLSVTPFDAWWDSANQRANVLVMGASGFHVVSTEGADPLAASINAQPAALVTVDATVEASLNAAIDAQPATLVTVNATVDGSGNIITVADTGNATTNGTNLQAAMNAAVAGDTLELTAGATYLGNFVFPSKTGSVPIRITTQGVSDSGGSSLAPNVRVSPASASSMAEIRAASFHLPTILVYGENSAGLELVGLNIHQPHADRNVTCSQMVMAGSYNSYDVAPTPLDGFLVDRCYVHGGPGAIRNGISLYVVINTVIKNSYITDTHGGGESHGIHVYISAGPTLIENNFVMSAAICIFIGDSSLPAEFSPDNVTILRNHLYKPIEWNPQHPSYNSATAWVVKNHIEQKGGIGLHVEGNLLQNSWPGGQDGDSFLVVNFAVASGNVVFRNNVIKNVSRGMTFSDYLGNGINGVTCENNLLYNSLPASWIPANAWIHTLASVDSGAITRHNTAYRPAGAAGWLSLGGSSNALSSLVHKDNLCTTGLRAIMSAPQASTGRPAVDFHVVNFDVNTHVAIGSHSDNEANYVNATNFVNWIWQPNVAAVQFTNTAFTQISHFALQSGSPYKNAASDGTDIGCNITALLAAMNASEIAAFSTD